MTLCIFSRNEGYAPLPRVLSARVSGAGSVGEAWTYRIPLLSWSIHGPEQGRGAEAYPAPRLSVDLHPARSEPSIERGPTSLAHFSRTFTTAPARGARGLRPEANTCVSPSPVSGHASRHRKVKQLSQTDGLRLENSTVPERLAADANGIILYSGVTPCPGPPARQTGGGREEAVLPSRLENTIAGRASAGALRD